MYFITNRAFDLQREGFEKLRKHPHPKGPNELSAVSIRGIKSPTIKLLKNTLEPSEVAELKDNYCLDIDSDSTQFASLRVACEVFKEAQRTKKSVVVYVHGYNNDLHDIYTSALEIEALYNVIVVPFTWPANGGGALSGTLSYLADKRDARASDDALNRFIGIIGEYHRMLTEATRKSFQDQATAKHPNNPTKQRELLAYLLDKHCNISVNLLCHSMGNYVLKHALTSSLAESRQLVFDNIILAAADTNNEDHEQWVEKLRFRHDLFILINGNDFALSWSRRKPGEEQKARLGHYLRSLNSENAMYIDFTRSKGVGRSHSYFDENTVEKNRTVRRFFEKVFSAKNILPYLEYHAHNNTYQPR